MECQCWHGLQSEQASPEELAKRGAGSAKSLLEGWVSVVTSRSAASRRVYARLTADALIFLKDKPVHEATDVRNGSPSALPLEMVMLTHMASVLGRAEGSEHVRVADSRGTWWQLKPEAPLQVADWAQALAKRFDKFKTARRRSSLYTPEQTKEIKVQLEAASKRRSFLNRLAGYVPCGGLHARDFSKAVGGSNLAYRGSREGGRVSKGSPTEVVVSFGCSIEAHSKGTLGKTRGPLIRGGFLEQKWHLCGPWFFLF